MADSAVCIYIKNFLRSGATITTEQLMQTVPIEGEPVMTNPKVKGELGKAGSFEFSMEMKSPYYDSLLQLKTILRVTLFGKTIFRGRVLTIDRAMARTRTVHCEGDFSFLLDSPQPGSKEDLRPTIGVLAYLQQIITNHNSYIQNDPDKKFVLGEVPGQYSSSVASSQRVNIPSDKANQKFGDTSWNFSMDRIEGLLGDFGGYWRTRYDAGSGNTYLDWFDNYYDSSINTQTIEITKNLIDISGPTEVNNIFTVVIPIGKNESESVFIRDYWPAINNHAAVDYIMVPELLDVYSDSELNSQYHKKSDYAEAVNKFGRIWKIVDFENANTPEKLFKYAADWIKNNYMPEIVQWSVSALDLRFVNGQAQPLYVGDRVNVRHPEVTHQFDGMTIITAEYDLYNPDKNKYTIGIPNQEINSAYGVKEKADKSSGKKSGKSGGGGFTAKPQVQIPDTSDIDANNRTKLANMYWDKTELNKDIPLDDPLAFLKFNTQGDEQYTTQREAVKGTMPMIKKLVQTRLEKGAELRKEALIRGVDINDVQLAIDFTPDVKRAQQNWKAGMSSYMVNDLGMAQQQAEVLINSSSGSSQFASFVDDNGNWTPLAYQKGIHLAKGADKIKKMAFDTRKLLDKNIDKGFKSPTDEAVGSVTQSLFGVDLNIGNLADFDSLKEKVSVASSKYGDLLSLDGENGLADLIDGGFSLTTNPDGSKKSFDLVGGLFSGGDKDSGVGKAFNFMSGLFSGGDKDSGVGKAINFLGDFLKMQDKDGGSGSIFDLGKGLFSGGDDGSGGKTFSLQSDTANIDGGSGGSAKFGRDSSGNWQLFLNEPMTYTDETGTHTVGGKGVVTASDFAIKSIPSFKTKFAVVDELVAGKATIGELNAVRARVETLETDYLKTNSLYSAISNLNTVRVKKLTIGSGGRILFEGNSTAITESNAANLIDNLKIELNGNQYTLYKRFIGDSDWTAVGSFSRATSLSGAWSSGVYTVTANPETASPISAKVVMPKVTRISSFMDIDLYNYSSDAHPAETTRYTVSADNDYAYIKWGSTTVARASHSAYSNGWSAAYSKVSLPKTQQTENAFIDIKTPNSASGTANPDNTRYTLAVDSNYAYLNWGSTTVARCANVGITVDNWSRSHFAEDTKARSSKRLSIPVSVDVNGVTYSTTFTTSEMTLEQYGSTNYVNVRMGSITIARLYLDND